MLETLHIQDFALIDDVEVEFRPGLNALTGETGAGKSIIVGALNLALGARASSDIVQRGARRAKIDALFRLVDVSPRLAELLESHHIEPDDGELLLSRVVTADGRSRAYVGGSLVPVSVLAQIGDELVDLHGQHDHQSLLKTDRQLELLDGFADATGRVAELGGIVDALRDSERAIADLETDDRERRRRLEFLRFEVGEIDKAGLEPGEEEELKSRRNLIANAEQIVERAQQAYSLLHEAESVSAVDTVGQAAAALEDLVGIDERFRPLADRIEAIRAEIDEVASEVRAHTDAVEFDPAELDDVNRRVSLIADLKRKYGDSVEAVLEYRAKAVAEIEGYEQRDERLAAMRAERDKLARQAMEAAHDLSKMRRSAGRKLDRRVTEGLQELGMKGGFFETRFESGDLSRTGIDKVAFMLSANPGETPKPLRTVASGGEISRVMLAIKTVLAGADQIPTLIFDEIDAGVGGAVAGKVAARLQSLAGDHQTLVITHLPQIAAAAAHHYRVSKATEKRRTRTTVAAIDAEIRVDELARLLDGSVSDLSRAHARSLLDNPG